MSDGVNKDILIVGGGIAGMQSALLLAEAGHRVRILDRAPAIGGFLPLLDRTFPTNSCGVCFMSPKPPAYCPMCEGELHENIEILTNCDVEDVSGDKGNFSVSYVQRPTGIDAAKCTLCGKCADACPVEMKSKLGEGVDKQKAAYLPAGQAAPKTYVIDADACTRCGECAKACPTDAVCLDAQPEAKKIDVGGIVLAFGFEPFQAQLKGEFGQGRYPNVLSSIQYERMQSHSSWTGGAPRRPSDGAKPEKIAFLQCVGSRDITCGKGYCSSVCCMYATKQAVVSKDRCRGLDVAVFYMDMRAVGKNYERYYDRAREEYGVRYLRSAVSTVRELKQTNNLLIEYLLDGGELKSEEFDMVVLSVGLTPPESVRAVAQKMGVELNEFGFCQTAEFTPTETSVPGVFVAGAFKEPANISDTVVQACAAAGDVSTALGGPDRNGGPAEVSAAIDMLQDYVPRVGVFICEPKALLSERLNVDALVEQAAKERGVACAAKVDAPSVSAVLGEIEKQVREKDVNRIVVVGNRSPEMGRALQKQLGAFGDCSGLVEFVNIGEECASVHGDAPEQASEKAAGLIRAGIRKARLAVPIQRGRRETINRALVVGGGVAGLSAALALAEQGIEVSLLERTKELGGNARLSFCTIKASDIQELVKNMLAAVEANPKIEVLTEAELQRLEGSWGAFHSVVGVNGGQKEIDHGVVVLATGVREVRPDEYLFGKHPNVISQRTFERLLAAGDPKATDAHTVVMIQCVGSRDEEHPYCSRICCGHAVKPEFPIYPPPPRRQAI